MPKHKNQNKVRIIGGEWRGRLIEFIDAPGLRPSKDFIRETLFNWLMPILPGCRCLDLFAGSGALGFESLSRGAAEVILIDSNPQVTACLHTQKQKLKADAIRIQTTTAQTWLQNTQETYDIIFLDPPFTENLLPEILRLIQDRQQLNPQGRIYLECAKQQVTEELTRDWEILRQKTNGEVACMLLTLTHKANTEANHSESRT